MLRSAGLLGSSSTIGITRRLMITSDHACPVASLNIRAANREARLDSLIQRLPRRVQATVRWLRRPASRWVRIPAGVLLIFGSLLSILPLFGFWMLPLGMLLLAEDVPWLCRARDRLLDWIERHRPHWFASSDIAN